MWGKKFQIDLLEIIVLFIFIEILLTIEFIQWFLILIIFTKYRYLFFTSNSLWSILKLETKCIKNICRCIKFLTLLTNQDILFWWKHLPNSLSIKYLLRRLLPKPNANQDELHNFSLLRARTGKRNNRKSLKELQK